MDGVEYQYRTSKQLKFTLYPFASHLIGLAGVSAAVVALAVRHGASGPSLAVTRTLLSFGALVFSCDVVVALVQKGSAREAGQLCCYAVETESADVVRQIAVEMLVEGRIKEAAAVAVAFAEAARAKWGNIDRVLDLLSEAISQAVRRDHAANVAEVTDKLVKDGHPELVTSIMQRMMDKGKDGSEGWSVLGYVIERVGLCLVLHGHDCPGPKETLRFAGLSRHNCTLHCTPIAPGMDEEAGKVSLAAAQRGKVGAMTGIMRDLASSQGGVSTLASVGLSAAKAGAQHVKDAIHSASAQLRQ